MRTGFLRGISAFGVLALVLGGASTSALADEPAGDTTLVASGTIMVVTAGDGDLTAQPVDGGTVVPPDLADDVTYSVVTDGGQVIPVEGDFGATVTTGDAFEGELVVPDPVAAETPVTDGAAVPADTALGEAIVDAAATAEIPLVAAAADVIDVPVANSFTPAAHFIDFAVVTPAGGSVQTGYATRLTTYLNAVGPYWVDATDGGISSITQDLPAQAYVSSYSCAKANLGALWAEAAVKFGRSSVNFYFGSQRHLVLLLPASCSDAATKIGNGIGTIGTIHSGGVLAVSEDGDTGLPVLAHEIGHNLGLGHSNTSYCGTPSYSEGSGCSVLEYYDLYSIMGFAIPGYPALPAVTAPQRDFLKGFSSGELDAQPDVAENPVQNTTYTLLPASDTAGLRSVRATDPLTGSQYYLELRSGTGIDASSYYAVGSPLCFDTPNCIAGLGTDEGVRILRLDNSNPSTKGAQSINYSVVTDPGDSQFAYMALHPGERFVSRSGGLVVTVNSMTPNVDAPTSASITVRTGGWTAADAAPLPSRISGNDRYSVAAAISQQAFPSPSVPVVYVTTGQNYPDALSAAPAATVQGGPLLLTMPGSLPTVIRNEIIRLNPARIVVVGGVNSVSAAVYTELSGLAPEIVRLGGADRYEASRNIVRYVWLNTDPGAIPVTAPTGAYVATGANFPDALSASGAGGALNMPVILVNGRSSTLDQGTRDLLADLSAVTTVKIAGGPNSVSESIKTALQGIVPTVTRLAGADRFDASKNVARDAFDALNPAEVYLSTGYNFPDALAGAALAGQRGAPLIVVQTTCIPASVLDAMDDWNSTSVTLLGGTNSLSNRVQYLMPC